MITKCHIMYDSFNAKLNKLINFANNNMLFLNYIKNKSKQ